MKNSEELYILKSFLNEDEFDRFKEEIKDEMEYSYEFKDCYEKYEIKVDMLNLKRLFSTTKTNYNSHILSLKNTIATLEAIIVDLTNDIVKLKNEKAEFESCTARVYVPNKSYKELEAKLETQEEELRKWETKITPLEIQIKDRDRQLELQNKQEITQEERIRYLKNTIENLNMLINYAIGYISSSEQFRDKHPNYVKGWLFSGVSLAGRIEDDK